MVAHLLRHRSKPEVNKEGEPRAHRRNHLITDNSIMPLRYLKRLFKSSSMPTFSHFHWFHLMLIITIIAGCTLVFNTRLRADDSGLLGAPLSQAQKTNDLFVFFNFAPIGKKSLSDGSSVTSFKPTGDAFRALVTLEATTAADGTIQKLHLTIARSFIDDSAKCVYAADLAKSFLLTRTRNRGPVDGALQRDSHHSFNASDLWHTVDRLPNLYRRLGIFSHPVQIGMEAPLA
jgi:hypothetical protein